LFSSVQFPSHPIPSITEPGTPQSAWPPALQLCSVSGLTLLVMLLCAAGWDCGYNRQEKWATELHPGDPGGQHGGAQPGPGEPGGAGGVGPDQWSPDPHREMCLDWRILSLDWFDTEFVSRGLVSVFLCLLFLLVNSLAYRGIVKSSSWLEQHPNTSYKLLYPWICLYFLANCAVLPLGKESLRVTP